MPEVKLKKPWRFYEDGCRPIDFKAGVVQMTEEAEKFAKLCDVIDTEQHSAKKPEKKSD